MLCLLQNGGRSKRRRKPSHTRTQQRSPLTLPLALSLLCVSHAVHSAPCTLFACSAGRSSHSWSGSPGLGPLSVCSLVGCTQFNNGWDIAATALESQQMLLPPLLLLLLLVRCSRGQCASASFVGEISTARFPRFKLSHGSCVCVCMCFLPISWSQPSWRCCNTNSSRYDCFNLQEAAFSPSAASLSFSFYLSVSPTLLAQHQFAKAHGCWGMQLVARSRQLRPHNLHPPGRFFDARTASTSPANALCSFALSLETNSHNS